MKIFAPISTDIKMIRKWVEKILSAHYKGYDVIEVKSMSTLWDYELRDHRNSTLLHLICDDKNRSWIPSDWSLDESEYKQLLKSVGASLVCKISLLPDRVELWEYSVTLDKESGQLELSCQGSNKYPLVMEYVAKIGTLTISGDIPTHSIRRIVRTKRKSC